MSMLITIYTSRLYKRIYQLFVDVFMCVNRLLKGLFTNIFTRPQRLTRLLKSTCAVFMNELCEYNSSENGIISSTKDITLNNKLNKGRFFYIGFSPINGCDIMLFFFFQTLTFIKNRWIYVESQSKVENPSNDVIPSQCVLQTRSIVCSR